MRSDEIRYDNLFDVQFKLFVRSQKSFYPYWKDG